MGRPGRPSISYRVELVITPGGPWRDVGAVQGTYRDAVKRAREACPERFRLLINGEVVAMATRNGLDRYSWQRGTWQNRS